MGPDQMLQKFLDFDCRLVFSAESFCWPDVSLAVPTLHPPQSVLTIPLLLSQSTLVSVWERGSYVQEVSEAPLIRSHIDL